MTSPTSFPGQTGFTGHVPVVARSFADSLRLRDRNARIVETESNNYSLPIPNMKPAYDAVRILTTDVEDLAEWLEVRGGTITVAPAGDGVQVWTLRTETLAELPKYPPVPVLVSVLVSDGEPVMPEISDALVSTTAVAA
ncbi:hypothetical protein [Streptomyces sp. NPDC005953]|uniref:hypothetical protein n=1 Tax=Streptomyces sp. NPDC005953 TaxID=3156719 RepID=UPI0033D351B1